VLGCLAVVVLDVIFDETRAEDAVFFIVLAVVMVGLAALARWLTRRISPAERSTRVNGDRLARRHLNRGGKESGHEPSSS
jgi:hypothetical protein